MSDEAYPKDWKHVVLHISPDFKQVHGDGDPDASGWVRRQIEKASGVRKTEIAGAFVVELTRHEDDRGFLFEIARASGAKGPHAVIANFGQVYLVGDWKAGTVRAFHKHERTWDWFCCVSGAVRIILRDGREDSPTHGKMSELVISAAAPKLLVIPPGVWHGWQALEDNTLLLSIASEPYDPEKPDEERLPYNSFGCSWDINFK